MNILSLFISKVLSWIVNISLYRYIVIFINLFDIAALLSRDWIICFEKIWCKNSVNYWFVVEIKYDMSHFCRIERWRSSNRCQFYLTLIISINIYKCPNNLYLLQEEKFKNIVLLLCYVINYYKISNVI